jgi:hypothetical protein
VGGSTATVNYAASPSGATDATRCIAPVDLYGGVCNVSLAAPFVMSGWFKRAGTPTAYNHRLYKGTGGNATMGVAGYSSGEWVRASQYAAVGTNATHVLETRDIYEPDYTRAEPTIDSLVWGFQSEAGNYPTELIPTTGGAATRAADQIVVNTDLVSAGRIGLELRLIPKMSSVEAAGGAYALWLAGTPPYDQIGIDATGHIFVTRNSVFEYTSTTAMAWARGDTLDIFVEAGGGTLATKAWYRVNGGAAVALEVGSVIATSMGTSPYNYLFAVLGDILSCWAQQARAYAPDVRPTWAV